MTVKIYWTAEMSRKALIAETGNPNPTAQEVLLWHSQNRAEHNFNLLREEMQQCGCKQCRDQI